MKKHITLSLALTINFGINASTMPKSYKYVAYYPSWVAESSSFTPKKINASRFTHINYAFMKFDDNGRLIFNDAQKEKFAKKNFRQLAYLKKKNPHLKTLISIGGGTSDAAQNFSKMAADSKARETFAESCLEFCIRYNFDGVDLDWEYPNSASDKNNFTLLIATLARVCRSYNPTFLITLAGPVNLKKLENFDFAAIDQHINWINLMAYDFHGPWAGSSVTNHLAPLFPGTGKSPDLCIESAINYYLKQNVKPEKIVLGIPLYARSFSGVKETHTGLLSKFTGRGSGFMRPGVWRISHITPIISKTHALHWDDIAQAAYYYNAEFGDFISCESEKSLALKAEYIKKRKLGGAMFWAIYDKDVIKYTNFVYNELES